ncbi:hypothetical protein ACI65C_004299 [Semiaphis heraclei]
MSSNNNLSSHVLQKSSSYSKSGSNVNRSFFSDDNDHFEKKSSKNLDITPANNNDDISSYVLQKSSSYSKSGSNVKRSLFIDDNNHFEKKSSKNLGNYILDIPYCMFLKKNMHILDTSPMSSNNNLSSHVLQKSSSYSKSGSNVNRSFFTDKLLYSSEKKFLKKKNPIPFEKHISSCLAEIKYEIKSHTYKIDCLNEKIDFIEEHIKSFKSYNKCIIGTTCNEILTGDDIMLDSLICLWPLKNDDDLYEFENILQDKTKKRQCVIIPENIYKMTNLASIETDDVFEFKNVPATAFGTELDGEPFSIDNAIH